MADEFGQAIPCADYAPVGSEAIGEEVLRWLVSSPVVLLAHHGVLPVGSLPTAAIKAAVMAEDAARICRLARQLGQPEELPVEEVARARRFHVLNYGQREDGQ